MSSDIISPSLPQELVDYIISFVATSKPTLLSCSLVHPTWVMTSRQYLFHTIQVDESRFRDFLLFVRSTSIGPQYVRDLTLNGHLPQHNYGESTSSGRVAVTPTFLADIVEHLPRLDNLFLFMVLLINEDVPALHDLSSISATPSSLSLNRLHALQSLKMYYCGNGSDTFLDFASILTLFPHISHLYLRSQRFGTVKTSNLLDVEGNEMMHAVAAVFPTVGSLKIDDNMFRTNIFLRVIGLALVNSKHVAPQNDDENDIGLHTLELDSRHHWDDAALGRLLTESGPRLKTLSIQMSALPEPEGTYLTFMTAIQGLIFPP